MSSITKMKSNWQWKKSNYTKCLSFDNFKQMDFYCTGRNQWIPIIRIPINYLYINYYFFLFYIIKFYINGVLLFGLRYFCAQAFTWTISYVGRFRWSSVSFYQHYRIITGVCRELVAQVIVGDRNDTKLSKKVNREFQKAHRTLCDRIFSINKKSTARVRFLDSSRGTIPRF